MKLSLSWLREFAPFEGTPEELGDAMSALGMAVESTQIVGEGLDGIVVAEVLALREHPKADRIQLVDVDAGDGGPLQIACGAFNMAVGDHVPLATIGTTMPDGMEIARRKMRGEWSNGMLCSGRELGLGDDHEGIFVLDPATEVGAPLTDALGIEADVVWDLEINPNRPDAMSVAGVARDLAAWLDVPFSIPEPSVEESGADASGRCSVEILEQELCGRFTLRILDGVTVGESPGWMQRRLVQAGMRPINSIVDISNYVMLELGQPNHTYDLAHVVDGALRVRWARDGEPVTTLDDVDRKLTTGDGVIADASDVPLGIAGVMGGASTEISERTTAVLLEMAWWDPMTIARSSRRLGLRSEASMRFERGADPAMADLAARRFAELAIRVAQETGVPAPTLAPGMEEATGALPDRSPVRVRTSRVNLLLGTELDAPRIAGLITPIGFDCTPVGDDLDVVVPTWRHDTATETDVVEEIARHHGYERLPSRRPRASHTGSLSPRQRDRRVLRWALAGLGLAEAMPTPLVSTSLLEQAGAPLPAVAIANPMAAEESVLRSSLRPGLVNAIAQNAAHRNLGVRLFEIGTAFLPPSGGADLPAEPEHLGVVLGGAEAPEAVDVLEVVLRRMGFDVSTLELAAVEVPGLHPTRTAEVEVGGAAVGHVGEIDPGVLEAFSVPERVAWLELRLDDLFELPRGEVDYRPVSRFPSSDVDLAFVVDEGISALAVRRTIVDAAGDIGEHVELFDVYRGAGLPDGTRSIAYRVRLRAADRTLGDAELAATRQAMIDRVVAVHGATLRG